MEVDVEWFKGVNMKCLLVAAFLVIHQLLGVKHYMPYPQYLWEEGEDKFWVKQRIPEDGAQGKGFTPLVNTGHTVVETLFGWVLLKPWEQYQRLVYKARGISDEETLRARKVVTSRLGCEEESMHMGGKERRNDYMRECLTLLREVVDSPASDRDLQVVTVIATEIVHADVYVCGGGDVSPSKDEIEMERGDFGLLLGPGAHGASKAHVLWQSLDDPEKFYVGDIFRASLLSASSEWFPVMEMVNKLESKAVGGATDAEGEKTEEDMDSASSSIMPQSVRQSIYRRSTLDEESDVIERTASSLTEESQDLCQRMLVRCHNYIDFAHFNLLQDYGFRFLVPLLVWFYPLRLVLNQAAELPGDFTKMKIDHLKAVGANIVPGFFAVVALLVFALLRKLRKLVRAD